MKCVQDALICGKKEKHSCPNDDILFYFGIYQTEERFEINSFLLCVKEKDIDPSWKKNNSPRGSFKGIN